MKNFINKKTHAIQRVYFVKVYVKKFAIAPLARQQNFPYRRYRKIVQ